MSIPRPRLSYANVTSTLALVAALATGGAYAAEKIGTDDIQRGAVTTPKLHKNAVTSSKIKNQTVQLQDLAADSVNTRKIGLGAVRHDDVGAQQISCDLLTFDVQQSIAACQ